MNDLGIERLLRISISLMIVLATLLLDMGQGSIALTLVTLVIAAVSAYVTDFRRWFSLNQQTANWIALGVVVVSAASAYFVDRQSRTFAVAHLQSYLQYVLLFQPKTTRVYWQLAVLSLGQLAIASTLIAGTAFAPLVALYCVLGIFTFALLLLHADAEALAPAAALDLGTAPRGIVLVGHAAHTPPRTLVLGTLGQSLLLTAGAVGLGCLIFFVVPRADTQRRLAATTDSTRTVGFTKTVTLGELGEVVNNPDLVMRVQFLAGRGNRPIRLIDEPLFRGTTVSHYENGSWTENRTASLRTMTVDVRSPFVRQRITAEPLDDDELFCIFPVFAFQPDYRLRVDAEGEQLLRHEDFRHGQLDFEIGTTGIVDGRQRTIIPSERGISSGVRSRLLQLPVPGTSGTDRLAGLRAAAADVLEAAGIAATERVAAARALSKHFSASSRYFYSLDPQPRAAGLDPLEDFVTLHPQGHCEYFAGALVMMLRSQGIPARMAIGFKGGEWNPVGMYYQVQQLHAHAWVEVFLEGDEIPQEEFADDERPREAWLVLDPTEGTIANGAAGAGSGLWGRLRQYADYMQVLWTNYFVNLSSRRQRQGIYEPLAAGAAAAAENLFGAEIWQARLRRVADSPLGTFWQWYRRHWFSWRGGLVAVGFSLAVLAIWWSAVAALRTLRRWWRTRGPQAVAEPPVLDMYRRLEKALARQGIHRGRSQTAYEFALAAGGELSEHVGFRRVAHLPRRIVDVFHRVRFGGRALDKPEAESLEHALAELDGVLARRG